MKNRSALAILFVIVFIDLLGFGMVIPVMALYAERLGAPDAQIGWLMTGYSAMQFVFTPIWGRLSDRHGRRPLLLLSIVMTAVGFLGYALAPSFAWLLVSRLFAGAATANIAIAQAYIADVTPPEGRARGMGLIGAAFGLGFVLGPAIGGLLSAISLSAPGYAAAALAAANGVAAFFVLPEPAAHVQAERRPHLEALLGGVSRPGIRRLILIYFIAILAFSGMEATFALLAVHRYGLDQRQVSYVFALIGVVATVVQGGLIGPLSRRFGERALLVAGLLLQAAALAALPYAGSVAGLLVATVPLAFGSSLTTPSLTSLVSRSARAEDQGGTLGIGQSAAALGRIAGPISATHAYSQLWFAAPYLGGAALMLAGAAVGSTLRRPPRHEPVEPGAAPAEEG
ncbi:major facilitator superfamily MFS_1 [Anaeromyxobacter dehalogenans 2CP-1]|uniref:Major facilitator superfamily MFS_1 n=1 Tax=Anaeromyxobacter dehalogenans (strain ATCC BAA-258 / DSM 21875 / 2CP-1) TaxID=455488 RepID=B8J8R2_ANAD2|nr:tetracycline resistance MFS efflux pump [Anaeromyxobacter dehalogenans]ACL63510.1 major facilitator superfamily MFS_1 [Anaeromyxobacter dehalogenans 2CP-1]